MAPVAGQRAFDNGGGRDIEIAGEAIHSKRGRAAEARQESLPCTVSRLTRSVKAARMIPPTSMPGWL